MKSPVAAGRDGALGAKEFSSNQRIDPAPNCGSTQTENGACIHDYEQQILREAPGAAGSPPGGRSATSASGQVPTPFEKTARGGGIGLAPFAGGRRNQPCVELPSARKRKPRQEGALPAGSAQQNQAA
jgi:hypothetical protein